MFSKSKKIIKSMIDPFAIATGKISSKRFVICLKRRAVHYKTALLLVCLNQIL